MDMDDMIVDFDRRAKSVSDEMFEAMKKEINCDGDNSGLIVVLFVLMKLSAACIKATEESGSTGVLDFFMQEVKVSIEMIEAGEVADSLLQKIKAQK